MGQIAGKSLFVASTPQIQREIRNLVKHLSSDRRSVVLKTSEVLAKLRASERRSAEDILRRRYKNGGLDYSWLTSFLAVLSKLKAEESQSEAE